MGIQATWVDDNQTAILVNFVGNCSREDLRVANDKTRAMVKSVSYPVDTVNDLTHSGGLPDGALTEGRAMMSGFESSNGLTLVIQASGLVISLYNVFQELYGRRAGFPETLFFDTREDAIAYLREKPFLKKAQ